MNLFKMPLYIIFVFMYAQNNLPDHADFYVFQDTNEEMTWSFYWAKMISFNTYRISYTMTNIIRFKTQWCRNG